jgi:hypothetical protein
MIFLEDPKCLHGLGYFTSPNSNVILLFDGVGAWYQQFYIFNAW